MVVVDVDSHWEVAKFERGHHPFEQWRDRFPKMVQHLANGLKDRFDTHDFPYLFTERILMVYSQHASRGIIHQQDFLLHKMGSAVYQLQRVAGLPG